MGMCNSIYFLLTFRQWLRRETRKQRRSGRRPFPCAGSPQTLTVHSKPPSASILYLACSFDNDKGMLCIMALCGSPCNIGPHSVLDANAGQHTLFTRRTWHLSSEWAWYVWPIPHLNSCCFHILPWQQLKSSRYSKNGIWLARKLFSVMWCGISVLQMLFRRLSVY